MEAARIVAWRTPAGKGGAGEGGGAGAGAVKAAPAQPPAQLLTAAVLRLHGQPLRVRRAHPAAVHNPRCSCQARHVSRRCRALMWMSCGRGQGSLRSCRTPCG